MGNRHYTSQRAACAVFGRDRGTAGRDLLARGGLGGSGPAGRARPKPGRPLSGGCSGDAAVGIRREGRGQRNGPVGRRGAASPLPHRGGRDRGDVRRRLPHDAIPRADCGRQGHRHRAVRHRGRRGRHHARRRPGAAVRRGDRGAARSAVLARGGLGGSGPAGRARPKPGRPLSGGCSGDAAVGIRREGRGQRNGPVGRRGAASPLPHRGGRDRGDVRRRLPHDAIPRADCGRQGHRHRAVRHRGRRGRHHARRRPGAAVRRGDRGAARSAVLARGGLGGSGPAGRARPKPGRPLSGGCSGDAAVGIRREGRGQRNGPVGRRGAASPLPHRGGRDRGDVRRRLPHDAIPRADCGRQGHRHRAVRHRGRRGRHHARRRPGAAVRRGDRGAARSAVLARGGRGPAGGSKSSWERRSRSSSA